MNDNKKLATLLRNVQNDIGEIAQRLEQGGEENNYRNNIETQLNELQASIQQALRDKKKLTATEQALDRIGKMAKTVADIIHLENIHMVEEGFFSSFSK